MTIHGWLMDGHSYCDIHGHWDRGWCPSMYCHGWSQQWWNEPWCPLWMGTELVLGDLCTMYSSIYMATYQTIHGWLWIVVRDPNSAHRMSELNYYNLQQSYRTKRHYQLTLYIYIYTPRQKHKRAGPYNHSNTINKKCGCLQQLQENHKVSKH